MGNNVSFRDKHVLVTGASTGIGLALAECFVRDGARVTLLARDSAKLSSAKDQLLSKYVTGSVQILSADVTHYEELAAKIAAVENGEYGGVDVAICNAGMAIPGEYVEQSVDVAHKQMEVNYFGVHHTAKAVLPGMLSRGSGHLCFIASAAALIGMVGYSTYSPTKYAVRGLADCLRNELLGTGVTVSLGYPPDTKTPGFDRENATKPKAHLAVAAFLADTVYEPEVVAASFYRGLRRGCYHLPNPDFMQTLLISYSSCVTPKPLGLLPEMLLAPLLVLIAEIYRRVMDSIVRKQNKLARTNVPQAPAKSD